MCGYNIAVLLRDVKIAKHVKNQYRGRKKKNRKKNDDDDDNNNNNKKNNNDNKQQRQHNRPNSSSSSSNQLPAVKMTQPRSSENEMTCHEEL